MKTTATCPKCGEQIASLEKSYISIQEVTVRHIKGDEWVFGEYLVFGEDESDVDFAYYRCPLCKQGVCHSDKQALEFLKGE